MQKPLQNGVENQFTTPYHPHNISWTKRMICSMKLCRKLLIGFSILPIVLTYIDYIKN